MQKESLYIALNFIQWMIYQYFTECHDRSGIIVEGLFLCFIQFMSINNINIKKEALMSFGKP